MFNNASNKIKLTALILFTVLTVISIISGTVCLVKYFEVDSDYRDIVSHLLFIGLGLIFGGPFLSWVLSLAFYGEAVLIDNTNKISLESDKYEAETNLKIAKIKRLKKYLLQDLITEEEYNNAVNKIKDL